MSEKSKCCNAHIREIWVNDHYTHDCAKCHQPCEAAVPSFFDKEASEARAPIPCSAKQSQQPSAGSDELSDEEFCQIYSKGHANNIHGKLGNWNQEEWGDTQDACYEGALAGIAEGRRRERERWQLVIDDIGKGSNLIIQQREQRAAREGYMAGRGEFGTNSDVELFEDWWKQRGKK